jgi:serine/threonine-protein kinase
MQYFISHMAYHLPLIIFYPSQLATMTAERQQQVKALFQEACERAPGERAAFLEAACPADAELRREVASLLEAYEQLGDFMRRPALAADDRDDERSAELWLLEAGQVFGHYRIERKLGAGGMGVVYLARDTRLERPVALKLLHSRFTRDRERVRRFQKEARAASALNHPNILTIYEVGQADAAAGGAHFIAAEFVEGLTLRARFRDADMRLGEALSLTIQIADALAAAHQAGIVHRDIKPENVMVRPDGIIKALDFGLAKLTEQAKRPLSQSFATVTTQPGMVMGTLSYMSPEQVRGQEVDARSDLFSFGVALYEMLAGRAPFAGETASDVIAALLSSEPPPLDHYAPGLPAGLQKIVSRALVRSVAERYQTAREFGDDLRLLKQELEFAARLNRTSGKDAPLNMKVGSAAANGHDTRAFSKKITRRTFRLAYLRGFLQRRGRAIALATAALALLTAGMLLGGHWLGTRDRGLDSVAVLPFANVGNDRQMEYLPDGITESLIGSLSQLPGLRVMARDTVFTYKGREVDPRRVGGDLNVRAVVTGRVRRQGERLVIRAELADATSGVRLWGEEYERPLTDILTVEREITREISEALRLRLSAAEQRQIAKRQSANSEAYRLYLLGRHLHLQAASANWEKSLAYFNQAIALDPNFALAHAGVSDVYSAISAQILPPAEAMPKARQAALTAIRLDETLPEAHHSLGTVKIWGDWDWAGAEREYKRAIELNPSFVIAYASYSNLVVSQGRFEEALAEARRAQELDPLSPQVGYALGRIHFLARRYDQALAHFRKMLEIAPNSDGPHYYLGRVLSQQGKHQEAISELRRAFELNRHHTIRAWLAYVYGRAGRRKEALKLLRELEALSRRERVSPIYIARIYSGLGDRENSLTWLRKAYDERSDHALGIGVDPAYDPLRSDPRFIEILRGVGLAQ